MEKYPEIELWQFTVQFCDRNTGIVLDHNLEYHRSNKYQKVYSIHNSLKNAIEYAESKNPGSKRADINVGYFIRSKNEQLQRKA